jgi:hypothetical protein
MTSKISSRDWETLTAYLDDQLSPKERSQFAANLEVNQELSRSLEELRRTRDVLRSTPRLRAPRNFTLTPEMAGTRSGIRSRTRPLPEIYPVLRLASILATFFFLVIFIGSLIGRSAPSQSISMAPAQEQPIRPPMGMGGGGGGGEGGEPEPQLEAPMEAMAPERETATEEKEASKAYETTQAADSLRALVVTPLVSPSPTLEPTPAPTMLEPGAPAPSGNIEVAPQFGATPADETQAPLSVGVNSWSILLIVQVLLAIVAVSAGIGAIFLRRSGQK